MNRKPTDLETKLIQIILSKSTYIISNKALDFTVKNLNDREMGSILLIPKEEIDYDRKLVKKLEELI